MQAMEAAKALAQAIQETPEYREYSTLKKEIDADAGIKALIQEYRRLQTSMQMRMFTGQSMDNEETQRFNSLNMLMFADSRTSGFRTPESLEVRIKSNRLLGSRVSIRCFSEANVSVRESGGMPGSSR